MKIDSRGEEEETELFGLTTFGKVADLLLRHKCGDMLSASGPVQLNAWEKDGERRRGFQIVADSLVSARTVRPGGGRKRKAGQHAVHQGGGAEGFQEGESEPFDDSVEFCAGWVAR